MFFVSSRGVWQKQHEPEPLPSGPRRRATMSLSNVLFHLWSHHGYDRSHAMSDRTRRWPWGLQDCLRHRPTAWGRPTLIIFRHPQSRISLRLQLRTFRLFSPAQCLYEARAGTDAIMMAADASEQRGWLASTRTPRGKTATLR
jgi:hypothetical protein